MNFFISFDEPELKEHALELSKELDLVLFSNIGSKKPSFFAEDYFLICSRDKLFLKKGLRKNSRPIFSDFDDWRKNYDDRLLKNAIKGLPEGFSCLDITAGFGKDALEISKQKNCKSLVLLEREKWLCKVLEDGLKNVKSTQAIDLVSKFKIVNIDNSKFIETTKNKYDLIYIDPMFSGINKSKAKKHMQAIRDLSNEFNETPILEKSLDKANFKVVVKRHKNMQYLEDLVPTRSVKGKGVRYDIYNLN